MTAPHLPPALLGALERLAHGLSRSDAATRAQAISAAYRSGGDSRTIRTGADALAYALARMPATYAAVAASLAALQQTRPDFAPHTLLDVGAGPGTATWAALAAFSGIDRATLLDRNLALRALALDLAREYPPQAAISYQQGDATALLANSAPADLLIASYVMTELGEADQDALAAGMWDKTRDTLVVIEPGTPAGHARLMRLRAALIANGAHVAAPCPHDDACPLTAPDWCHFAQRLPRSRDHKRLKDADAPFEDEKFSYVALSRSRPALRPTRVLAPPQLTKVEITAKLCTAHGLDAERIPRRDKPRYAQARRWRWGDAVSHNGK